jgi:ferritin-like metal-binding protein YciE
MLERFRTHGEAYQQRLEAALGMERTVLELLELGVRNSERSQIKELLGSHLEDSRRHVETLETVFLLFGWEAAAAPFPAMEALAKECKGAIKRAEGPVVDAVVLQIALEAEHLRIGVYENLVIHAKAIDRPEVVERLQRSLGSNQLALDNIKLLLAETLGSDPAQRV